MKERIYLSPPYMGGEERSFVEEAFDSNFVAPLGPMVDRFERDICSITGAKACAALSSGTGALHLALIISGVHPGDEVICPSFTFVASANAVVYAGANPVFVDSEPDTWNMDPALLEEAILDRKKKTGRVPAAIIVVHLYGMPAKLDEILCIADKYEIPLVEDAAESLGAKYRQKNHSEFRMTGTFGRMGVYSFNGNKIITTSGGGALISDSFADVEKARYLATQAREPAPHYEHITIGYNYRMSNILAAIGCGQLQVLNQFVERCREINKAYKERLEHHPGISFLCEPNGQFYSNFWLTTIVVDSEKCGGSDRETIRLRLEELNIESRPLWKPMHLQPVFQKLNAPCYGGQVCESFFKKGLCLPSGVTLTDSDLDCICSTIRAVIEL